MNKAIQSITNRLIFCLVLLGLFQVYELSRWATIQYEKTTQVAEVINNPLSLLKNININGESDNGR